MTTPDELQRAVERLKKAVVFAEGASLVDHEDIDFLLSERAELLAAVERMRDLLLCITTTPSDEFDAVVVADRIRAALTTGEEK
jgi:hypothetical protein